MIKVLFLIHDLGVGGAEKVLVNLVNHMDKTVFDITVIALFGGGVNEQFLNKNVRYISVFKKVFPGNVAFMKLFSPRRLHKWFIKDNYDIEISYLEGPSARIISGCDSGAKLVSWIHVEQKTRKIADGAFRNHREAFDCYRKFHRTICVSEAVKDDFTALFPKVRNIEVLYNTIESDLIRQKAKEKIAEAAFRQYCGVKVCIVGKIAKNKGIMRLARIHKRLIEKGYDHRIYALGVGSEQEAVEQYLRNNGLTDSFIFLGYKTNPYKYIAQSDLLVCASYSEGFSTAVTEALIVGTPVVTTLCAGMKELLGEDNEYGLVTENDEAALEKGLETILFDTKLLEHYREKAVKRGQKFVTNNTVQAVENMLDNL